MMFEKLSIRLKKLQLKKILNIYLLYLLAIISIIVCIVLTFEDMYFSLLIVFGVAIVFRVINIVLKRRRGDETEKKFTDWKILRQQLTQILSESKILLNTAVELKSDEASVIILSEKQVNGNFFEENKELIESIRKIGIDGLLCLMFLIQQQPAIASVRAIQKSLKIPLTSVYRQLQKLTELELVITYYTPEKPSKALYKITDEGSSIIIQLYELLGGSLIPVFESPRKETKAIT